jgi:lauroyl/myristoyl acyltransferase
VPSAPSVLSMRFRLEYALVSVVERCIRVMPMPMVRACGTLLGLAAYTLDRGHRRVALDNLAQAFPMRTRCASHPSA